MSCRMIANLPETGWFRGADRKWRFEIDDSGMKYHKMGDAQFSKDRPKYARFRDLERKFVEGTVTDDEIMEMAELRSTWANEAPRLRQMVVHGNAKLRHVLAHDALFEQYPQLLDISVRFGDTDNAGGYWDQERNEIVISNRYRHADPAFLELKLLHEIQHAIQDIEGFAGGSSPEYWEEVQKGDKAIRENDGKIAKAEREAQAALEGIPPEVAKDFWYAANMRETDPEGAQEISDRLENSEYWEAFADYDWAIGTIQELMEQENPKRTAKNLYRNTAGEIEARNAANRRGLDAGVRKNRLPNTGDERTVFVEGDSPVARSESIVDQMHSALPDIMNMESVAAIDPSNATVYTGVHKLDEKAGLAEFRKQGGTAYRVGFGKVLLSRKGVVDTVFHGNGPAKQASFPAIKSVIENGLEIGSDPDHKGRGYDTFTFAAPIDFFGKKKLLGVVVKVYRSGRGDTSFYIHEICDSEGNYVRMDAPNEVQKEISNTGGLDSSSSAGIADSEVSLKNSVTDSGYNVKQYSISEPEESGGYTYSAEELAEIEELRNRASMEEDGTGERAAWTAVEPEKLTGTVKQHYDGTLRRAVNGLAKSLNVPGVAKRDFLKPIAEELGREYMQNGTVSAQIRDRLFDTAWNEGRNQEREFYDTYKEVKDYLRTTAITLGEEDRDSRDWKEFQRRAFDTLKLRNEGGLPVHPHVRGVNTKKSSKIIGFSPAEYRPGQQLTVLVYLPVSW